MQTHALAIRELEREELLHEAAREQFLHKHLPASSSSSHNLLCRLMTTLHCRVTAGGATQLPRKLAIQG